MDLYQASPFAMVHQLVIVARIQLPLGYGQPDQFHSALRDVQHASLTTPHSPGQVASISTRLPPNEVSCIDFARSTSILDLNVGDLIARVMSNKKYVRK